MNISLVNTQTEEKIEMIAEITDNKLIENPEDNEIDRTEEDQIMSDISAFCIHRDTDVFSSGMDKTRSFKKLSLFTLRSNISGLTEQTSTHSTETTLTKYSKYVFYDDNV
ncbi:hypothetical protein TNCT_235091 [Trichonephila clavata]|uniref:Uncharacterized protein n=1 Tax=Trichonephila clavata TaxID=2740835 RepID=A0A8X6HZ75_TRICU|nr:hypothetical protein TNCT_235091 [Trichonephila clavata]